MTERGPEPAPAGEARASAAATLVHATTVALDGRALLISGGSGAGKSGLALILLALGARLVADDYTLLQRQGGRLWARPPPAIRGLIEARGLGILRARALGRAQVVAELDLDRPAGARLPHPVTAERLGLRLPLLAAGDGLPYAAALIQYLREGRAR